MHVAIVLNFFISIWPYQFYYQNWKTFGLFIDFEMQMSGKPKRWLRSPRRQYAEVQILHSASSKPDYRLVAFHLRPEEC